jgi:hypothetical protein
MPKGIGYKVGKGTKKKAKISDLDKPFPEVSKQSGKFFQASLDEGIDNSAIRRSQKSRRKRGINGE